jgi:SAM-dependent methyltransferase
LKFEEGYTKYWESAVSKSIDGTQIAGINEANYFLKDAAIKKSDLVLDVGCSFGRMYPALSLYSSNIYGVDPDIYAVNKAKSNSYVEVKQGTAEDTKYTAQLFDIVFCWAVFDVVDHVRGLSEFNRVLKNNGTLLLTGKNDNYFTDDKLAYTAEKNAFLKSFPNKFTNLQNVLQSLPDLGFTFEKLFIFPRRGDFGTLTFESVTNDINNEFVGYEYLLFCKKVSEIKGNTKGAVSLESTFSKTMCKLAQEKGFSDAAKMFQSIGLD